MIKYQAGTVMPEEYDWREQFKLETNEPFLLMDTGKIRGLVIAYEKALSKLGNTEIFYNNSVERLEKRLDNYATQWPLGHGMFNAGMAYALELVEDEYSTLDAADVIRKKLYEGVKFED